VAVGNLGASNENGSELGVVVKCLGWHLALGTSAIDLRRGSPYSTGAEVPEGELTQSHTSCF